MGYELASALIERDIKTKAENARLQQIISQLQKEKRRLEEEQASHLIGRSLSLSTSRHI